MRAVMRQPGTCACRRQVLSALACTCKCMRLALCTVFFAGFALQVGAAGRSHAYGPVHVVSRGAATEGPAFRGRCRQSALLLQAVEVLLRGNEGEGGGGVGSCGGWNAEEKGWGEAARRAVGGRGPS